MYFFMYVVNQVVKISYPLLPHLNHPRFLGYPAHILVTILIADP